MSRETMHNAILRSGTMVAIARDFGDSTNSILRVYVLRWDHRLSLADLTELGMTTGLVQKPEELRFSTDDYGAFILTSTL